MSNDLDNEYTTLNFRNGNVLMFWRLFVKVFQLLVIKIAYKYKQNDISLILCFVWDIDLLLLPTLVSYNFKHKI